MHFFKTCKIIISSKSICFPDSHLSLVVKKTMYLPDLLKNFLQNLLFRLEITQNSIAKSSHRSFVRGCLHKIAKNYPPLLVRKMSALVQPSFHACPSGHTINFEKFRVFCTKRYRLPHLKTPPPLFLNPLKKFITGSPFHSKPLLL